MSGKRTTSRTTAQGVPNKTHCGKPREVFPTVSIVVLTVLCISMALRSLEATLALGAVAKVIHDG